MSDNQVTRFVGGSPGRIAVQLVVVCFFVGLILNALGVSPYDIVNGLRELALRVYNMGWGTVEWIIRYILLGAVIVVPVWLIMRLSKLGRRS